MCRLWWQVGRLPRPQGNGTGGTGGTKMGAPRCRWIVHRWGELEITPDIRGPKTQPGSQFSGGLEIQKKPAIQSQNPLQKGREPMLGGY